MAPAYTCPNGRTITNASQVHQMDDIVFCDKCGDPINGLSDKSELA